MADESPIEGLGGKRAGAHGGHRPRGNEIGVGGRLVREPAATYMPPATSVAAIRHNIQVIKSAQQEARATLTEVIESDPQEARPR
eukprot:6277505-Pyramimonas_sp.AAC.1